MTYLRDAEQKSRVLRWPWQTGNESKILEGTNGSDAQHF